MRENAAFDFRRATRTTATCTWRPYAGLPAIDDAVHRHAIATQPDWYRNFLYAEEAARGLDCIEDLASPGTFAFDLAQRDAALVLRAGRRHRAATRAAWPRETVRPRAQAPQPALARWIARPTRMSCSAGTRRTIIAGYPWFTDWGRDTFIAMRGLAARARPRRHRCHRSSRTGPAHVSRGHAAQSLPRRQRAPAVQRGRRLACGSSSRRTRRWRIAGLERAARSDAIGAILDGYARGTRYGIRMDEDGLLACGVPGVQLTWMDARVDGQVITPRIGKPVEVQALWINALRLAGRAPHSPTARERGVSRALLEPAGVRLYDVVDADHVAGRVDASVRPNQIFAVGRAALRSRRRRRRARSRRDGRDERWSRRRVCARSRPPIPRTARATKAARRSATAPTTRAPCGHGSWAPFVDAWLRVHGGDATAKAQASASASSHRSRRARSVGHRPPVRDRGRRRAARAARMPVPGVVAGRAHPREEADGVTPPGAQGAISPEARARRVVRPVRDKAPRTLSPVPSSSRPSLIARACTRFQRGWSLHSASVRLIAESRGRRSLTGRNEMPGAGLRGHARLVDIDDGVGEPAYARNDRQRTVSQRAHLRETAGLESRRHEHRVGSGLHEMREAFVVAHVHRDAPAMRSRRHRRTRARATRSPLPSTARCAPPSSDAGNAVERPGPCPSAT